MHPRITLSFALLLTTLAHAGDPKTPIPAADGWQWSLSGGPAWHYMGNLSFAGGSRSQSLTLPSFVGTDVLTVPPIGSETMPDERFYNDGYVRQDAGTPTDGSTWFWGYDNASQVQGSNLVYQATGFQSIRRDNITTGAGALSRDSLRDTGIELRADLLTPWKLGPFRVGGMIGLGIVSADQSIRFSNHNTSQFRDDYRLDYVDSHALGGVIPPQAPYSGTITGPGPLIPNAPASRGLTPVLLSTDSAAFTNQVQADFRDDFIGLTVGPSLIYQNGPWTFVASGGLILELHHYTTRQYEQLNVTSANGNARFAQWAEGDSGIKFRPGLFAQAAARYDVGNNWHLGAYVRGEIADEFRVNAGPSMFRFEPLGFTLGCELGYTF